MRRNVLIVSLVSFLLVLLLQQAYAANCGGAVACNCGDTLNESRTLNSSDNLMACSGYNGVVIVSSDIILDCDGNLINGSGGADKYGISSHSYNNLTIQNCNIMNFDTGVYLINSSNNSVHDNNISYNQHTPATSGIFFQDVSESNISGNHVFENDRGVHLNNSDSNIIESNLIENNNYYNSDIFGYGIYIESSNSNNITGNTVLNHTSAGIYLKLTNGSNLINNTIVNNPGKGIELNVSSNNIISGGEVGNNCQNASNSCAGIDLEPDCANNLIQGIYVHNNIYYYGIGVIYNSNNNTIENNNVYANGNGIDAGYSLGYSNGTIIQNNNITNSIIPPSSGGQGIYMTHLNYAQILNNTIKNNSQAGLALGFNLTGQNITGNNVIQNTYGVTMASSAPPNIWHNNIYNNSVYQAYSTYAVQVSNGSEGNYWGRSSCPLFIAGNDSNDVSVVDSYSYNSSDGWLSGSPKICDFTVPTVSISRPTSGANISGGVFSYKINGTASDNINVTEVNLSINGVIVSATLNETNWNYTWATTSDGLYNITAIAYDADGNNATDTVTNIVVDNTPPSVTIISPTAILTSSTFTLNVSITSSDAAFCHYARNPPNATQSSMSAISNNSCTGPEFTIPNSAGNNITFYISDRYTNTNVTLINFTINDTTAPSVITRNVSVKTNSANISWTTNENSNGSIKVGNNNITVTSLIKTHSVSITGLSPSTNYRYNITSCDINHNCQTQGTYSFTTSASAAGGSNQSTSGGGSLSNSYLTLPFGGETRNTILNGGTYNYKLSGQNSGDSHKIRVIAIDGKSVLLEFSSTSIKLTFTENETKQIDLEGDNVKDIEFTVEQVFANSIRFRLKNLLTEKNTTLQASVETNKTNETAKKPVVTSTPQNTSVPATTQPPEEEKPEGKAGILSSIPLIPIIIAVGLIILIIGVNLKHNKRQ